MLGFTSIAYSLLALLLLPGDVYTYPLPHVPTSNVTELHSRDVFLERREVKCNIPKFGEFMRTAKAINCKPANSFKYVPPNLKTLKKGTKVNSIPLAVRSSTKPPNPTCDHILELNILKTVLEQDGGVCASMQSLSEQQQRTNTDLLELRRIINNSNDNLSFFTALAESKKTALVQAFQGTKQLPDADPFDMLAAMDYIRQTSARSKAAARKIDQEIATRFPGATGGVEAFWDEFLLFSETSKPFYVKLAELELSFNRAEQERLASNNRRRQCNRPESDPAPPNTPALIRRQSTQAPPNSPGARRGKGAAPSCPAPGAPPKKVVPRNSLTPKPAPNRRLASPTRPTTAPRPPPPAKKVVPRPADRPKRQPGTPKPQPKRTTPKRKPRQVPKRPNGSRGSPRRRRG